ncbi:MAG: flagellar hook capping FlgD N-terminal domain-containing protein [Bdellovibrionota bacterium]
MSVMNVKPLTQAFAPQQVQPKSENDAVQNHSAGEMKDLGGSNVGEVLNKLADSNYVDPSKRKRAVGSDKLDKDAFFKLMLAQMKNQDPTNPLKSHEMAAQLANFSGLEQMQNVNATLTEMKNGQKPMEQYQALNFIGKAVAGDSSKLIRAKGDKEHDFTYSIPANAKEVKIQVKNDSGEVVKSYNLKAIKAGENKLNWAGENEKGEKAPAGEYSFSVEATAESGQKMGVKTNFDGIITGVNYTADGPVLMVGNQSIRLKDVRKIVDPSLMKNDQNAKTGSPQDLKTLPPITQTKKVPSADDSEGAPDAPVKGTNKVFDTVGLSSEMKDRIAKETSGSGEGG